MKTPFRVGFCVSGAGRLMRAAVIHARTLGIEPALVVLDDKASSDIECFCTLQQVRWVRIPKLSRIAFDRELHDQCANAELNLLCLTFDKIVSAPLIRHFAGRIINVHPALLPAFPGMNALAQAAERRVRFIGATIHEADELVDNGAIIAQCVLGTRLGETADDLGRRLFPLLRLMFLQVLAWYASGRVEKGACGRPWVRDAIYGESPISPALEMSFPD